MQHQEPENQDLAGKWSSKALNMQKNKPQMDLMIGGVVI